MVQLIFYGSKASETNEHELKVFCNSCNDIYISIEHPEFPASFICLDKSTAIKLSKELRKQIALIEDERLD